MFFHPIEVRNEYTIKSIDNYNNGTVVTLKRRIKHQTINNIKDYIITKFNAFIDEQLNSENECNNNHNYRNKPGLRRTINSKKGLYHKVSQLNNYDKNSDIAYLLKQAKKQHINLRE